MLLPVVCRLFANLPAKNLSHQCRNPVLPSEKKCPRRLLRDSCPNLSEELDSSVLHLSPIRLRGIEKYRWVKINKMRRNEDESQATRFSPAGRDGRRRLFAIPEELRIR